MRFSFPLGPFSRYGDVEEVADLARVAEQAGFWHVSMGEHVIVPGNGPGTRRASEGRVEPAG